MLVSQVPLFTKQTMKEFEITIQSKCTTSYTSMYELKINHWVTIYKFANIKIAMLGPMATCYKIIVLLKTLTKIRHLEIHKYLGRLYKYIYKVLLPACAM